MKTRLLFVLILSCLMSIGVKAQFGNALNFQFQNSSTVSIPHSSSLDYSEFSIELWVKPEANFISEEPVSVVSKYHTENFGGQFFGAALSIYHYGIYYNNNKFYAQTGGIKATQQGSFETGRWYHVAATFSNSAMSLYVDGVLQETVNPTVYLVDGGYLSPEYNGDYPIKLGQYVRVGDLGHPGAVNLFSGSVDELRIWNYMRSGQQIKDTKDSELNGNETGLVAYYNFNQGNAGQSNAGVTTLTDKTANGNNGTLSGFALSGSKSNWIGSYAMVHPTTTTATAVEGKYFTANWTAPASSETPSTYYIDISTDPNFSTFVSTGTYSGFSEVFYNNFEVGAATSFRISNLLPITTYYYRVRAKNSDGSSPNSNVTSVTTADIAHQTITISDFPAKTYGDTGFTITATSSSGLPVTLSVPFNNLVVGLTGNQINIANAGSVVVTATQAGNDNYYLEQITRTLTVNKAVLNVIAENQTTNYGSATLPFAKFHYSGWLKGAESVYPQPELTTLLNDSTPAGVYPGAIVPVGGHAGNYTLNYVAADQTVIKVGQVIAFSTIADKSLGDADFDAGAYVMHHLPITYNSSNPSVAVVLNGKIHLVGEGICTIYANQPGDKNHTPANEVSQQLVVHAIANALNFDGVDDYVDCGNILTGSYTKEAWIRLNANTGYLNIISGNVNHAFWVVNGQLCAGHNGGWFYVLDGSILSTNTWTHVAVTYDMATTTMKLYKNGILIATNNSVPPIAGDNSVLIGAYANTACFSGIMDEVKLWNRALSANEIYNDKNSTLKGTESGLLAYYDMNQGVSCRDNTTQTTLINKIGQNNGTLHNFFLNDNGFCTSNYLLSDVPNVLNNAINFDGADDFVDLGNNGNLKFGAGSFSLSTWFKTTQATTGRFVSNGQSGSATGYSLGIANGKISFAIASGDAATSANINTLYPFNDDKWHNAIAVCNKTNNAVKLYMDGIVQPIAKTTGSGGTLANDTTLNITGLSISASNAGSNVVLGKSEVGNNEFYNGTLDEVSFWNTALNENQIEKCFLNSFALNSNGLAAYYKMNQGVANANNAGIASLLDVKSASNNGTLTNFAFSGVTSNWVDGFVQFFKGDTIWAKAPQTITFNALPFINPGDADYAPVATATSGSPVIYSSSDETVATIVNGKIHVVGTGTCTIYANQVGNKYYSAAPQMARTLNLNNAINFNGIDGGIYCSQFLTPSYTKEAWVKLSPLSGVINTIISGLNTHFLMIQDGKLTAGNVSSIQDNNLFPTDVWIHVAVTYDATTSTMNLYKDGVLVASSNSMPGIGFDNYIFIGNTTSRAFKGEIDNVKIWNRVLTTSEISANSVKVLSGTEANLLAYYDMNQGVSCGDNSTQNSLIDKTGLHNGVFFNMDLTLGCDANFIVSDVPTLPKMTQTITFNTIPSKAYNSADFNPGAIVSSGLAITYSTSDTTVAKIINGKVHIIGSGTCIIYANQQGNSYYLQASQASQTLTVSPQNRALNFDGVNDFAYVTTYFQESYTKEAWVRLSSSAGAINNIISGTGDHVFQIASGKLQAGHNQVWNSVQDNTDFPKDTWTHVAVTYDAPTTTLKLYKNGVLVSVNNNVQPFAAALYSEIGSYNAADFFKGDMDEVKIWNRALSSTEINNRFVPLTGSEGGLDFYFDMNQGVPCGDNTAEYNTLVNKCSAPSAQIYGTALSGGCTSNFVTSFDVQSAPDILKNNINYVRESVDYLDNTMEYSLDGGNNWTGITGDSLVVSSYLSNVIVPIQFRYKPNPNSVVSLTTPVELSSRPGAPTSPIENTTANTFGYSLNPSYLNLSAYEYSTDGGATYQQITTNPISIGSQQLVAGNLSVRVKAIAGVNFAGLPLQNVSAYNIVTTTLKNTESSNFNIIPNPANDYISVSGLINSRVAIYDLKGRLLLNEQANGKPIDIRNLAKGIYVVKVVSEDNQMIGKLMKE